VREGDTDREEVLRREIDYTKENISLAPNNASAWNYLRGVLQKSQTSFAPLEAFVMPYTVSQPIETSSASASTPEEMIDLENPLPSKTAKLPCSLAIEFLADIYLEKAAVAEPGDQSLQKAVELFDSLATTHDTIRKRYWEYRRARATKKAVASPIAS